MLKGLKVKCGAKTDFKGKLEREEGEGEDKTEPCYVGLTFDLAVETKDVCDVTRNT